MWEIVNVLQHWCSCSGRTSAADVFDVDVLEKQINIVNFNNILMNTKVQKGRNNTTRNIFLEDMTLVQVNKLLFFYILFWLKLETQVLKPTAVVPHVYLGTALGVSERRILLGDMIWQLYGIWTSWRYNKRGKSSSLSII